MSDKQYIRYLEQELADTQNKLRVALGNAAVASARAADAKYNNTVLQALARSSG